MINNGRIREEWINAKQENTLLSYFHFWDVHPHSDYSSEAKIRLDVLKSETIQQMRVRPNSFCREEMYEYITNGIFTYDELVIKEKLLSIDAYNHIRKYPHQRDEQSCMPVVPIDKETYSKEGNTDIIFIGTCGSGGKTCLMASIMALLNKTDFKLSSVGDFDNSYAEYLADYMKSNRLPPATDQSYVQVVNTLLKVEGKEFGVSFIEFAGEQIHDMVGNTKEEGFAPLYPNIGNIFKNNNRKILFLSIDPTSTKPCSVGGNSDFWVYQSDIYEMLVSLLKYDRRFCDKIIGMHLVITKRDLWETKMTDNSNLNGWVHQNGYKVTWESLCNVCKENEIMQANHYTPTISAFSIGKFMIGDTYSFDDRDAKQIKNLICGDLVNYYNKDSFKDKFKRFFNS